MIKILIVCCDRHIRLWLEEKIRGRGFSCEVIDREDQAPEKAASGAFKLMVWNHMNTDWDHELLRKVVATRLPVILTGEPIDVDEQLNMLLMGVDDYVTMPVHTMELLARVEVTLKRHQGAANATLSVEDVTVEQSDRIVIKKGRVVRLTPREYALLTFLMRNRNVIFSRERLLMEVWKADEEGASEALVKGTRTVDAHILRIRKKLGLHNALQTVYNAGYRLVDNEARSGE